MANTVLYTPSKSENASLHVFNMNGLVGSYSAGLNVTIGRRVPESKCDIQLDSPIISRAHAVIGISDGNYYYRDTDSTNGAYINSGFVGKGASQALSLSDGDVISFELKRDGFCDINKTVCIFSQAQQLGEWDSIQLTPDIAELLVGRGIEGGIALSDLSVSEKHASFFQSKNGWAIIDHKSTNGVFVNGKRLKSPKYLSALDVVRISDVYFVFLGDRLFCSAGNMLCDAQKKPLEAPAALGEEQLKPAACVTEPQPVQKADTASPVSARPEKESPAKESPVKESQQGQLVISIIQRSVVQRFKKLILLQDINMTINNGEMVLILGGSGAGKTTFINAVMGYEKADGKILYNDTDIYAEYEQMKYEIGFVPQQDLLRGSDTVYDTLSNSAEMKLPRNTSIQKREERINAVLDELGLSRERTTLVSKLSGGQRKRLSIAVEFISDPSLFFLDEPDSGIDDIMGRGLMENLRHIADSGKIVMVITHSPERAFDLFDKVIVLAKSSVDNCGHLAFYGTVESAFDYFEVKSFREIVKKINRKDENGDGLSDFYIDKYAAQNNA